MASLWYTLTWRRTSHVVSGDRITPPFISHKKAIWKGYHNLILRGQIFGIPLVSLKFQGSAAPGLPPPPVSTNFHFGLLLDVGNYYLAGAWKGAIIWSWGVPKIPSY